ncbi:MAG: hypothetical protein BMS9Abin17_0228 [Acidimicrobiia bacterium]|nr:MAG: hypothetical protein BMS9Abin17_0228 [Acidimicrobiia bacterium]
MVTRRFLIAIIAVIAVVGAACTSGATEQAPVTSTSSTTSFVLPELEFGRGSMPPSIPASFPTPEQAVVGATMMAGTRNVTEVVLTFPADLAAVVAYYTNNLPVVGYEVGDSSGTAGTWSLTFSGEGLSGEIRFETVASSLTTGTLLFTHG